jgi:branched-chain amino acid transport system permease protein
MAVGVTAVSGGLAGLAGSLLTFQLGAITPSTGDQLLIKAFAAIILGGVGSIGGTVLGALTLAVVETLLLTFTSGTWVDGVSFALIFAILLLRPRGIFGAVEVRRT